MRIVNLIENTEGSTGCICEHGLSFYVETKEHKLLVDTGASSAFLDNAKKLGIKLKEVDTVIISHGHYDHTGGLLSFMEINKKAKIYIQKKACGAFYNTLHVPEKYIGMDEQIKLSDRVFFVDGDLEIDNGLVLFSNVTGRKFWPSGNLYLKEKKENEFVQDEFAHEQCLLIRQEDEIVLMSGCAHNGMINILDAAKERFGIIPTKVCSGFHMMKKNGYTVEDEKIIEETAKILKELPTLFYTGHCTDIYPYEIMKKIMNEKIVYVHSGDEI